MFVISGTEAIRKIVESKRRFACYLGSGASVEANVSTASQICADIRARLAAHDEISDDKLDDWAAKRLNWNDPARRYVTCIRAEYQTEADRIAFFRRLLLGKLPSFSHHGIAMLMTHKYLKHTCITTNFDKLVESAFAIQGHQECQAIRSVEELRFWREGSDRSFILKLHGDYDTYNILNTQEEVILIPDQFRDAIAAYLKDSGLVVLGSAGWEKSINTLFDYLGDRAQKGETLQHGLLWGVHMDTPQPRNLSEAKLQNFVMKRVSTEVSPEIRDMLKRVNAKSNEMFCFFPVWGTGVFLFQLIEKINRIPELRDRNLLGSAITYLDQEMRLEHTLRNANLPEDVIKNHIERLRKKSKAPSPKVSASGQSCMPETFFKAVHPKSKVQVRALYGDVTARSFMQSPEFSALRRAVVSPEDTLLTAGGGVAFTLLKKADKQLILNELQKFSPILHKSVAVTSAGRLPVHYIFHTAALNIGKDGTYSATANSITESTKAVLHKVDALEVGALWIPLLAAGVGDVEPNTSLRAILTALRDWKPSRPRPTTLLIFIHRDAELNRHVARKTLQSVLKSWQIIADAAN